MTALRKSLMEVQRKDKGSIYSMLSYHPLPRHDASMRSIKKKGPATNVCHKTFSDVIMREVKWVVAATEAHVSQRFIPEMVKTLARFNDV